MSSSTRHLRRGEVEAFLENTLGVRKWAITEPGGSGNETYFAKGEGYDLFVKVDGQVDRALAVARNGLTPPVVATGTLKDGTPVLVQRRIDGVTPTRSDLREHMEQVAVIIGEMHRSEKVRRALPEKPTERYRDAGMQALASLRERWQQYRPQVPESAEFVNTSLDALEGHIDELPGAGLVASHGDICNANWILTPKGRLYLVDLEAMSLDDPALDLGAMLWWYYPEEIWDRFLALAGYESSPDFDQRMQLRLAMHILSITLPRPNSFDSFDPAAYDAALTDFRAVMHGEPNPQRDLP
jgi:thiamine kinase-like enzyme